MQQAAVQLSAEGYAWLNSKLEEAFTQFGTLPAADINKLDQPSISKIEGDYICPECGHKFRGNKFDGIDLHRRSQHNHIMPYKDAWPLIKNGTYTRADAS